MQVAAVGGASDSDGGTCVTRMEVIEKLFILNIFFFLTLPMNQNLPRLAKNRKY